MKSREIGVITTDSMHDLRLVIPEHLGEEDVPLCAQFLCACAAKWRAGDIDFVQSLVEWFWAGDPKKLH